MNSQVKLELEVTLTPEAEVSSTVASNNSNNSCDSDQSNDDQLKSTSSKCIPTVIPPTTIVCLPSCVVPNSIGQQTTSSQQTTYLGSINNPQPKSLPTQNSYSNNFQRISMNPVPPQRTAAVVASSSAIPYLSLATTQPLRAVPNPIQQIRQKIPVKGGRGRTTSNRPPPGAVNLERSYQICQAVIQNSPNRHQLKAHLKPPALFGSNVKKDENSGNAGNKTTVC